MRAPVNFNSLRSEHRGLLLDKYFPAKKKSEKESLLPVWKAFCASGLTPAVYQRAFERWKSTTAGWENCARLTGKVRGRLAIGLGIENVHEIGCRLHATYGTPVIPGSSLKGLLRAGLRKMPEYAAHVTPLFGSAEESDEGGSEGHQKGAVDVFDAWWIPESGRSGLAPDVITVHHPSYYGGKPGAAPDDREAPVPNHYLTVTGSFYFVFVVRAEDSKWANFVGDAAKSFLSMEGIGAKRSSGYGRFKF